MSDGQDSGSTDDLDATLVHVLGQWREHTGEVRAWRSLYRGTVLELTAASGDRFVLKEVGKGQDVERRLARLASEHRLLGYLRERGVPAPVPLPTEEGVTYVRGPEDGTAIYTLHRMLPNWRSDPARPGETRVPQWEVPQTWTNVGAAIGRLHRALAAYTGEIVSWHMVLPERIRETALPRTRSYLTGERLSQLDVVFDEVTDEVCERLADLPEQYIHGDCHGGNILVSDCEVSGFIDLDHLPLGEKVYDLFYLLADRLKWRIYDLQGLAALLPLFPRVVAGYETENTLTEQERGALWPGMLATQLFFVQVFAQEGNEEHLPRNLDALTWIYQHREELERLLSRA